MAPLNVTQFFDGLVTIVDPALFSDTSAKIRASVVGSVIAATGKPLERLLYNVLVAVHANGCPSKYAQP